MSHFAHDIMDSTNSGVLQGGPSFGWRNRAVRAVWSVAWLLLAAWTPPALHPWRAAVLRAFGASIGRNVRIHGSARIWLPANLACGDGVVIGPRTTIYCIAPVALGAHAIVSQGAHLCTGTHLIDSPEFQLVARPIRVGRLAWIAAEAFVGPGVSIGDGAVLGARGVSFDNLSPWTVYIGNPAQRRRERLRSSENRP